MSTIRVLFAGGGTGGHLFPAIAIADEVKRLQPDAEIHFVGTKKKIEARIIPERGYAFHTVWISGFSRRLRFSNILFPLKVIVSFMQALLIIRKLKPDVVVGTGGYVSGPVLRAAISSNIPTLIQEQNSYPGVTTRMLAPKVNEVHATFERSLQYFNRKNNVYVSGNPTRSNLDNVNRKDALTYFGFDDVGGAATLLIIGGSLGAHSINRAVMQCLDYLVRAGLRIIWQTGAGDFQDAVDAVRAKTQKGIWIGQFIDRMDYAYEVADIVLCRAGATSIAELTRLGKVAILVPYPYAAADHQSENARSLASAGAAIMLPDDEVSIRLQHVVDSLLDPGRRSEISALCKKFGKPDAALEIARRVLSLAGMN